MGVTAEASVSDEKLEIFPTGLLKPLALKEIFGNSNPIEIDLGSGPGKFLIETAERYPDRNFLGVERLLGRVRKTRRKAAGLMNVRLLRGEIDHAVDHLLSPQSISRIHLSFPDPWPKRRHHRRRLVSDGFFERVHNVLSNQGEFRIKTDHEDYFRHVSRVAAACEHLFEPLEWVEEYPMTDFEELFLDQNLPIYRLRLGKR